MSAFEKYWVGVTEEGRQDIFLQPVNLPPNPDDTGYVEHLGPFDTREELLEAYPNAS